MDSELEAFLEELREAEARRSCHQLNDRSLPESPAGYRILREIHRGGQGIVYETERVDTGTHVALKVVLERMALGARSRYRFEREVELVGSLHHPGIVSLFDSGVMPDGRLFLVMELIEGKEIGEHVRPIPGDAPRLELVEILDLFLQVGSALEYAHRHRVVHRDLKTQNVLVDSNGNARLLDFGIAKVLTEEGQETAEFTATGEFLGSFAWAAPEQLNRANGVDTRTDVYSLGLLLYYLLTGQMPYSLDQSVSDLVLAIVSQAPAPMMGHCGAVRIPRDLEAIVLHALEKEPSARYASITEFCVDVRRFLVGAPVQARENDLRYILGRLVLQNRVAAAAVGLLFTLLVVVGWQREVRARELAVERSEGRVDEGRLWGAMGRVPEAEDLLWGELLEPPPGTGRSIGSRAATWALRGLYSRYPCLTTKSLGPGRILGVSKELLLFLPETASKTEMDLLSLPGLDPVGIPLTFPEGGALDRVQLTPDGEWIVVLLQDGRMLVRATRGALEWDVFEGLRQRCLQWVENDRFLSIDEDGCVWSWRARLPLERTKIHQVRLTPDQRVYSLHTTQGGRRVQVIIQLLDYPEKFLNRVVDVETGEVVLEQERRVDLISRDGRSYIMPGRSLAVLKLPAVGEKGQPIDAFRRDSSTFGYAVRHPYKNLMAWSGGAAKSIEVIELETGRVRRVFGGHRHRVASMAFAGKSDMLVSLDVSGTAKVWDTEQKARSVGLTDSSASIVRDISAESAGKYVAWAEVEPSAVVVLDLQEHTRSVSHDEFDGRLTAVDLEPHHGHLVATTCSQGGVYLIDWRGHRPADQIGRHMGPATAVGFSPARRELASVGLNELILWDTSGAEQWRLDVPHPNTRYTALEWDATGEWIALGQARGGRASHVVWFRRSTREFVPALLGRKIRSIAYSGQLDRFAVGDDDGWITIWRPGAAEPEALMGPLTGEVDGVSFDETGALLAGTGSFGDVCIFDARSGELLIEFPVDDRSIVDLEFIPGGRLITASRCVTSTHSEVLADRAALSIWNLSDTDASLLGNFEYQAQRLTAELARSPSDLETVSNWVRSLVSEE